MSHPVLEARALTKSYGRARGITDIDLSISSGEVVGLVGANGAGKSTFMRTVLDFIRPTTGEVSVFGLDSVRDSVEVRRRSAYLPGELVLPPRLTGHEVLERFAFTRSRDDRRRMQTIADRLSLDLSRRVGDLSKGNKQKVGLVLAFAPEADLFVLDEPTSGLDPLLQREFSVMVREVIERGATVLLSSHVMSEVEQTASRVALLRDGRLVTFDRMDVVRERARRHGRVRLADETAAAAVATQLQRTTGVTNVSHHGQTVAFSCAGSVDPLIKALAAFTVVSLDLEQADLEDAFFLAYGDESTDERTGDQP